MTTLIRLTLSAVLIYFVFQETGIATTIAFSLILLNSEIAAFRIGQLAEIQKIICDGFGKIAKYGEPPFKK